MSKRMTERRALEILFNLAAERLGGTGTGIGPPSLSNEKRLDAGRAVKKLWPKVFSWPMGRSDCHNLNIPPSALDAEDRG